MRIEDETIVEEWIDFFVRRPISPATSTKEESEDSSGKPSKQKQARIAECSVNTVDKALTSVYEPHEKMNTEHSNSVVYNWEDISYVQDDCIQKNNQKLPMSQNEKSLNLITNQSF